jgi:PAS domain S-box-containing protein
MIYSTPNPEWRDLERSPELLQYTNDLISLLDMAHNGAFVYASPSYLHVLGYDPALFPGKPNTVLIHHADQELVKHQLALLDHQTETQATIRHSHANGSWRWIETRWHRIRLYDRVYVAAIGRDATEERRLKTRLAQIQKLNSIGRLAAGVAHDFHNVMAGIDGYATLALSALPANSSARADLKEIQRASARASNLTSQLLSFARRTPGHDTVFDLNDLINDVARLLHRLLGEDIELVISQPVDSALIEADPAQIEQVLMNLVMNARDAMPFGGQLIIETARKHLDQVPKQPHTETNTNRYILLTISDTGIGMEPQTLTRIFEPFFTTKPTGSGTGLGLAISNDIIQQYGGWISAQSQPGEGTTFSVYLPAPNRSAVHQVPAPESVTDELPEGSETILLVEDDPAVRSCVVRLLSRQGYHVLAASDGVEALKIADDTPEHIDLLLADLVLPKLNGKALTQQLRLRIPALPVVLMSGYPETIIAQYQPFEAITILPKPVALTTLLQVIRTALDAERPA